MRRTSKKNQRGAALILTVIVIMVLTTLGMAMVAFTTTEERTATTYRDSLQTRALAEAGVRIVQEMFRTPTDVNLVPVYRAGVAADDADSTLPNWDYWGATLGVINTQLNEIGIWRKDRTGANPAKYSGNDNRFFYPPFRDTWSQTFGGSYSTTDSTDIYDLRFNCHQNGILTNALIATASQCWLDTKINALLVNNTVGTDDWNIRPGKVVDISFYAPPAVNSTAYGITTVRVTAEKYDDQGVLLARETVVALIGDKNPEPAVLGNGNIRFITQAGQMCGDGCENIHANGNAEVGTISGGTPPMVTATGTVNIVSGSSQPNSSVVTSPDINPWDDAYKPRTSTDLANYFLATSGPLPVEWTDMDETNNPASRACGLSTCQDYGLEYPAGSTVANGIRLATDVPNIYRWVDTSPKRWTQVGCATATGVNLSCGGLQLTVTPLNDTENLTWTGDTMALPYNVFRVPQVEFALAAAPPDGYTLLVDGKFAKRANGSWNPRMAVISAGSQTFAAQTEWYPATASQRVMWISGRDLDISANCCAPSNTCATNLANNSAQGIIAVHEQMRASAQTALAGILIAENKVDRDTVVTGTTLAIDVQQGDHDYVCGVPSWPWIRPTKPEIFSMTTAPD